MMGANPRRIGPGFQVDGFRLHEKLYDGGMSTLWRVTCDGATMPMVMKIPIFERGDPVSSLVGFEMEQMILPLLSGPHVPRFVQNGEIDVLPYIVMEFVEGADLLNLLDRPPLHLKELVEIGSAIATALHDLHRQGAVHLDIKPENIMRRPDGSMVLVDFGLACHEDVPDLLKDHFHVPLGTAAYIAPEQILGIRNDSRSDLFALGALLYSLATGHLPFGYPKNRIGLRRRLWRQPLPPRSFRPELPPWFQEIILRLLEIDPDARYQTGGQLALDFDLKEAISLTDRADRTKTAGFIDETKCWYRSLHWMPTTRSGIADALVSAPLIMVAVDLSPASRNINIKLERVVRRVLYTEPLARVVCFNAMEVSVHQDYQGAYYKRFVEMKAWAGRLKLSAKRLICIVVPAEDASLAIIDYAARHHVDHIVIGVASGKTSCLPGPVASRIINGASCNVTIVRNGTQSSDSKMI